MTHQPRLIKEETAAYDVDEAQKEAYRERLRKKLQDPEFRQIEGFPLGEDEAILALSDPPYYTACPNPFLPEIIEQWRAERAELRRELGLVDDSIGEEASTPAQSSLFSYRREPFASDVSEGKNNPIYRAHSYHTKVPHKAIMRYILHYSDPGDIVFDGFCGTGMTGVAAQLCADRKEVESLGYRVDANGEIYEGNKPISRLGARKAMLNDLSPAATFIAYNYNTPVDVEQFELEAQRILNEVEEELGWMYETWHPHCNDPNRVKASINYTIWSDVLVCPQCGHDVIYWDIAVDEARKKMLKDLACPNCGAAHTRKTLESAWTSSFDPSLNKVIRQIKKTPVLINYNVGQKRFRKQPDGEDRAIISRVEHLPFSYWYSVKQMPEGDESRRNDRKGLTNINHFFTRRNLYSLATLWQKILAHKQPLLKFCFTAGLRTNSRMSSIAMNYYFHGGGGAITNGIKGTFYMPSLNPETPPLRSFPRRVRSAARTWKSLRSVNRSATVTATQSSSHLVNAPPSSVDYVFVDPPFGANLMYSELNFFWESWLKVFSHNSQEAIVNRTQAKGLTEYQRLMESCFREFYRILKPSRWITVEFHNSKNTVWNSIQEALLRAGFIIAGDIVKCCGSTLNQRRLPEPLKQPVHPPQT